MTHDRRLKIYDGQDPIGLIVDRGGGRVDAFDVSGAYLGTFKTVKTAMSAVNSSVPLRSCVADSSARMDGSG